MKAWRFPAVVFSDLLDMLVVGVLIYTLLVWFKRTKTAFVALGILVLAAVFTLARIAGMHMTTWIFQGFFAVLVIAIVVIFQEELRSIFERIAIWSLRGHSPAEPSAGKVEMLVRTLGNFARERIGALVVLRGTDPLDRHLEGGWVLNGQLSEALLESIFDSHSLGHDGAVVIEEDRMTRFGVHLPLSKSFAKLQNLGTRHTAAMGLSERADALCLVVSEERGTISLARGGELLTVSDLRSLEREIEAFIREKAPAGQNVAFGGFLTSNAGEKVLAAGLAVLLWLVFIGLSRLSGLP